MFAQRLSSRARHVTGACVKLGSIAARRRRMACTAGATSTCRNPSPPEKRPVLLLDVMDTIVYDPFYQDMPKFFSITLKELLESKHPTAWVEFENSLITEEQLFAKFFKDGRDFDGVALVRHMVESYRFLDGMEDLLQCLHAAGYELHAMSNYPVWYRYIEEKLRLSRFLRWTFVSCEGPMRGHRKPAASSFQVAVDHLALPGGDLLLVDDRQANVEGARSAGLQAIHFLSAAQLEEELRAAGLVF